MQKPDQINRRSKKLLQRLAAAAAAFLSVAGVQAASATYNFDADPASILQIVGNNPEPWKATGGNTGGFLAVTYPENSQYTGVLFPDIDAGKIVTSFKFECDLRVGNSVGDRPADGFSISFARGSDPLVATDGLGSTGNFAGGIPEGGSTTGIAISFDTWSGNTLPDGADIEGIIVRVDNKTVLRKGLSVRHGACADVNSLQTGPRDAAYWAGGGDPHAPESWAGLCWQPFLVELDETAKLTVKYKGATILDKFQTTYFPTAGRLIFAGRTGGANEHTHVDNIRLTTTAVTDSSPPLPPSNLASTGVSTRTVAISWTAGSDDSGRVAYEVERDGTIVTSTAITGTSFTDTGLKPNTSYSYKVRSTDPGDNKSAYTAALAVKTAVETLVATTGFATFEAYTGIGGTPIDNMINDPKYPDSPDIVAYASALDTRTVFGDDSHENYGGRIRATLTPTESGDYEFFLRSDDASQLFLSSDDNRANLAMIAEETGCCGAFEAPGAPETSAPIPLVAGRKYAIEVLWKEGGGGDYAQVAWRKAGDTTAPGALRPIAGSFLSTPLDPEHGVPIISQSPQSVKVASGANVTMSVAALGTKPLSYQWRRNGENIAGATSATLTINGVQRATAGDIDVVVSNFEGSSTSRVASITLTDVPTVLFIIANSAPAVNNASDAAVKARLQSKGWQVEVVGALASQASDATGKALIVVSSTVPSGDVSAKFNAVPVGLINWENALEDNLLWTTDEGGTTRGTTGGQTQVKIQVPAHPLAAGLSAGLQTIVTSAQEFSWGVPAGTGVVVASLADDDTKGVIYAYDKDALLIDGTTKAPARRVNFGMTDNTFLGLNETGLKLFDAAVAWTANVTAGPALADVTKPGDPIVSTSPNSRSPAGEQVPLAIDDKTNTKYLNFDKLNTGFTVAPSAGASVVSGLTLTSANDAPERDPASYKLEGSNDGGTFTLISEGAVAAFTARFAKQEIKFNNSTPYFVYRLTFPTVANAASANSMQIAEVELLGTVTGGQRPTISAARTATGIRLTYTGTLEQADSVTGPWTAVSGASPLDVTVSGAQKFYRVK